MTDSTDAIVIGSGAGGASTAFKLVKAGKSVLVVERGGFLPRDGSTLDVRKVFVDGTFSNKDVWIDDQNRRFMPDEFHNVGGKTKWYGAALFRFADHEFGPDESFRCHGWPIGPDDYAPYYDEAEKLLAVTHFDNEPELQALIDRIVVHDGHWKPEALPLGLKKSILDDPEEAKHFDGFASVSGYKSDAQLNILDRIADDPNYTLLAGAPVAHLIPGDGDPRRVVGVRLSDGSEHRAPVVVLAAGAMTSPRLLQDYLAETGLDLPNAQLIGANFRFHLNSALLGFTPFRDHDVLRKTAVFFNEMFPHSTMQCLGWMDGEMIGAQLPAAVPALIDNVLGARAIGFWATTEDGSHPENRIVSGGGTMPPILDYKLDRIPDSLNEHHALIDAFEEALVASGVVSTSRYMGLGGTAHAMGSLMTGTDPDTSVIDPHGKVHGMEGLFVGDGSALPRSSRVNPSFTIYAWGLRLGDHLGSLP